MTEPRDDAAASTPPALDETSEQEFVGERDLTVWRTRSGRWAAALFLRMAARLATHRALAVILALGLAVVGLLGTAAAAVYDAVVEADGVARLDQPALDTALSLRSSTTTTLVKSYTWLGGPVGMPLLAAAIALTLALRWRQRAPLTLVAVTAVGSLALTVLGKATVARTRPPLREAVPPFESSFSFPSGHALNATAIAGIVAYLLIRRQRTRWARSATVAAATVFAVAMGLSRVYLGHHWLTDVLVAWALGLAWLAVVICAHRLYLTARRAEMTTELVPQDRLRRR